MKLKTRFWLTNACLMMMFILGGWFAYRAFWLFRDLVVKIDILDSISLKAYQLRNLSLEIESFSSERAIRQWKVIQEELERELEQSSFPPEISEAVVRTKAKFSQIQGILSRDAHNDALSRQIIAQHFSSLHLELQRIIDWTHEISGAEKKRLLSGLQVNAVASLLFLAVLSTVISAFIAYTGRHLFRSVRELSRGTERIASGDFGGRINLHGNDEISELARSFERMGKELSHSYERIKNSNRILQIIDKFHNILSSEEQAEETQLRELCRAIRGGLNASFCWIGLQKDGDDGAFPYPRAWDGREEGYLESAGYPAPGPSSPSDPVRRAVAEGRIILLTDITPAMEDAPWRREALRRDYGSILILPFAAGDSLVGCIALYGGGKALRNGDSESLLQELAHTIETGIRSRRNRKLRLEAEAEALKMQIQLAQAQKMESVGRLAGGVAHDFNNMLSVISGYAQLALMEEVLSPSLREHLEEIKQAAKRSSEITRQLLAFARKQTIRPVVLNLNGTVGNTIKMIRRLIGEDIELIWEPGGELWNVRIDPSQVDQLLANLVTNARDSIAGVGVIRIWTGNVTLAGDVSFESAPGDYVVLSLSDNGCGIAPDKLSHIFDPFYTTKELGKGTGLGLAMVYGICKQNGGFVTVESELGAGTTFHIHLPRATEETPSKGRTAQTDLIGGKENILVVDDEKSLLLLLRRSLESLGYHVWSAGSPEQALKLARDIKEPIHLLITDVVMPGMNGRELAEQLAALKPGVKCLFISGYTADMISTRGVLAEGVNFIQKPYTLTELAQKTRMALDAG